MVTPQLSKTHAMWAGAGLLATLTAIAFPYPICVAVGAILGAMLVEADYSLPGPRSPDIV